MEKREKTIKKGVGDISTEVSGLLSGGGNAVNLGACTECGKDIKGVKILLIQMIVAKKLDEHIEISSNSICTSCLEQVLNIH